MDDIKNIIAGRGWFVISATREELGAHDAPANLDARLNLLYHLDMLDLPFIPCTGVYRGVEQGRSFLVLADEPTGRQLRALYRQESILTPDGLVGAKGRLIARRVGDRWGAEATAADFFSAFRNGLRWSAELEFI